MMVIFWKLSFSYSKTSTGSKNHRDDEVRDDKGDLWVDIGEGAGAEAFLLFSPFF